MSGFPVGSRVRIKPELADGFLQPLRKWAQEGRAGTVDTVMSHGALIVKFDCARKPRWPDSYRQSVHPKALEPAP